MKTRGWCVALNHAKARETFSTVTREEVSGMVSIVLKRWIGDDADEFMRIDLSKEEAEGIGRQLLGAPKEDGTP